MLPGVSGARGKRGLAVTSDSTPIATARGQGRCRYNDLIENLWDSLKIGRLQGKNFAAQHDAMDETIDGLIFYNRRQLLSTLGCVDQRQDQQIQR